MGVPNDPIEPALAEKWEVLQPTVWRFHLRKNVRFSNGDPFSADDVVFTYRVMLASTALILVIFTVVLLVLVLLAVVVVAIRQEPRDTEMSNVAPSLIAVVVRRLLGAWSDES